MKLYTEEQLKQAVDKAMSMWLLSESSKEEILDSLTPIELPSDEDIINILDNVRYCDTCSDEYKNTIESIYNNLKRNKL